MPKKVLINARLLSPGGASGIEEHTRSLVAAMLANDRANRYEIFYNGWRKVPLPAEWGQVPVVNRHIPNKLFDASVRFMGLPRMESFADFDVLLSPHFNIVATAKPHVMTFHDLSFVHYPEFFSWRKQLWHWFQDCRGQAHRAARIVAVSEFTKSDLVEVFGVPAEKVSVIYSGVSRAFRQFGKGDAELTGIAQKYHLARPFILYLGTIEPRKNIRAVIKAFSALKEDPAYKEIELVLAGQAGWLLRETIREARHSKFSSDIRFLGRIAWEERAPLLNLAQLFVYPSFFEGFGLPPLEAQACGTPVIASNRTSLPEILGSSAILVDPWKVDELYMAMKDILSNPAKRAALISAGFENVKKFSWEKTAGETCRLFGGL